MNQTQIIEVFNQCFLESERTRLEGEAEEPWYQPRDVDDDVAVLYCRSDYPASALHEAAHWCLATRKQREQDDFGFSYIQPPRTLAQQRRFFELELRVQSLEALFADAAGVEFRVSADSFDVTHAQLIENFAQSVEAYESQTRAWLATPEGCRANQFLLALSEQA